MSFDLSRKRGFRACFGAAIGWGITLQILGCATLPETKVKKFTFPKEAFVDVPQRPFRKLGLVRTKVNYTSLNENWEESNLCKNYFNKAAVDLVKRAKERGADAVIEIRSIVFLVDGRTEAYAQPECSDDGGEGQVLAQGIAVKWDGDPERLRKKSMQAWEQGKLRVDPRPVRKSGKTAAPVVAPAPALGSSGDSDDSETLNSEDSRAPSASSPTLPSAPPRGESEDTSEAEPRNTPSDQDRLPSAQARSVDSDPSSRDSSGKSDRGVSGRSSRSAIPLAVPRPQDGLFEQFE